MPWTAFSPGGLHSLNIASTFTTRSGAWQFSFATFARSISLCKIRATSCILTMEPCSNFRFRSLRRIASSRYSIRKYTATLSYRAQLKQTAASNKSASTHASKFFFISRKRSYRFLLTNGYLNGGVTIHTRMQPPQRVTTINDNVLALYTAISFQRKDLRLIKYKIKENTTIK